MRQLYKKGHDLMYDKYRLYKKRFDNLECIELKNIIEKHKNKYFTNDRLIKELEENLKKMGR